MNGIIDAHSHVWTPDLQLYPLCSGYSPEVMQPTSFTADELLSIAKPLNVSRIVLIQMVFYGSDNSYLLDSIRNYPGTFSGVAQIDERGADPAGQMRRLKPLGVHGIRISPLISNEPDWLDHSGMHAMWHCGAQDQIAMCPLINPGDLPAIDAMCTKYPETTVVIDHFARIGGDGAIRNAELDQLCLLARHPRTHVKLSAFYFLGRKQPPYTDLTSMIYRVCEAFGPQRLMWASDSPFQLQSPHTYAASLELVQDHLDALSEEDKHWIMTRSAEQVFFPGT